MKKYLVMLFLLVLVIGCTKVEVDQAQKAEDAAQQEPVEPQQPAEAQPVETPAPTEIIEPEIGFEGTTIEIKEGLFDPEENTIEQNTEVKWVNKDAKEHKIACYLGGTRVTTSSNLKQEGDFTYTFLKDGKYTCIDAIYGLRSYITVKPKEALLSPTGNVVLAANSAIGLEEIGITLLTLVAILSIFVLSFFIYGRKR